MNLNERQTAMVAIGVENQMSGREIANFIAQMSYESNQLRHLEESFIYKSPNAIHNLQRKVPSVMREGEAAFEHARVEAISGHPEKLAELMYGGRMGNHELGEGWKFHGRGYIQLTGKANYEAASERLGIDLVNHPELVTNPDIAAKTALDFWTHNVPRHERESVRQATQRVNGEVGADFAHRNELFQQLERTLTPQYLEQIRNGSHRNSVEPEGGHSAPYWRSESNQPSATTLAQLSPATQSLHADVSAKVQDLYTQHNQPIDQGTHNTAMQVTVALAKKGATGIERIAVKDGHIHAMQMRGEEAIIASVNTNEAANTPTDKSLSQLAAIDNTQSQMQANPTQNLNQSQSQGRSIV